MKKTKNPQSKEREKNLKSRCENIIAKLNAIYEIDKLIKAKFPSLKIKKGRYIYFGRGKINFLYKNT